MGQEMLKRWLRSDSKLQEEVASGVRTFMRLEALPLEISSHIVNHLTLKEKIRLRCVSRGWKEIAEVTLENVKWLSTGQVGCVFPSGCLKSGKEVCAEAENPDVLIRILKLCPRIQKLELDGSKFKTSDNDVEYRETVREVLRQLQDVNCLAWRKLDLKGWAGWEELSHLRCNSITSRCMRNLISIKVEGLAFWNAKFQWNELHSGLKFLIEEGKEPSIDFGAVLQSDAAATIQRLKINCVFPDELPVEPVLPQLQYLRIRDCHETFSPEQLELLRRLIQNSPVTELFLGVPNVLHDPLNNLTTFFSVFHRVQVIRQALFIEEHQLVQHLVDNSPNVRNAELIVTSITNDVLNILLGWKKLKKLTLASPGTLRRCTSSELLEFIQKAFIAGVDHMHIIDKLTFTKQDQDRLVQIMDQQMLNVAFRFGKRFVEAKQKRFRFSSTKSIKCPMIIIHRDGANIDCKHKQF